VFFSEHSVYVHCFERTEARAWLTRIAYTAAWN